MLKLAKRKKKKTNPGNKKALNHSEDSSYVPREIGFTRQISKILPIAVFNPLVSVAISAVSTAAFS